MKQLIISAVVALTLAGCYQESAIPLGNDMMEVNVSAAPLYGRAGVMDMALKRAATATINAGYDKFIVVNDNGWNESQMAGGSYGQASANTTTGQASSGSFIGTSRHPEAKMIIRMFRDGDEGSEKAVDARSVLSQQKFDN